MAVVRSVGLEQSDRLSERRNVERPLNVLFLAWRDLAHPQAGGSEVLVDRLAAGLVAHGHRTALVCGAPREHRSYPVVENGGTYSQYLRAPLAYWRWFRTVDVVVDVENGVPFFSPFWRQGPVVCLVHHIHTDQWAARFRWPMSSVGSGLERRVMPWTYRHSLFVAVSNSTVASLHDLGVPPSHIRLVSNGVDLAETRPPKSPVPLFVAISRLVPHKRVDLLLRVWREVRPRIGGTLVIVGTGPEEERLRAMAPAGVEFRGHVPDAEKSSLLGQAWFFVHAAHHEGWGISIMEAAATGTPSLAIDAPGVRDAVLDGRTGILATSETAMAASWVRLARDSSLRRQLGTAALKRALSFTWAETVNTFIAVLRESIARTESPRPDAARQGN